MHKHHTVQRISKASRVRTLAVSLTAVLVGATLYASNVRADDGCGVKSDFLVKSDPLMAPVRPADCARLYEAAADFAWPQARAESFVVTLRFPDGRVATAPTSTNWLSWEDPLPPGEYTWTVTAVGARADTSAARRFTVDSTAGADAPRG
jgi:hypothetical protein